MWNMAVALFAGKTFVGQEANGFILKNVFLYFLGADWKTDILTALLLIYSDINSL